MPEDLFCSNTPENFWHCETEFLKKQWQMAARDAACTLELSEACEDIEQIPALILGEGQFGPDHWDTGLIMKLYYFMKPAVPRFVINLLRSSYHNLMVKESVLDWPVEPRYVRYQLQTLKNVLQINGKQSVQYRPIWPEGNQYAFVLTHDIETRKGLQYVRRIADLEESFGFRSSFNFVPESYNVDRGLLDELRQRGFEVGLHGLKHDGKLFNSRRTFQHRAAKINQHLECFQTNGFRAPLTIRNPEWMQALEVEYDLSFFDTDPFEPISGGTMSIWPFIIGRFVELPYTLVQDHTLTTILGEITPRIWLEKVDFIEEHHGMALLNTHPDYLLEEVTGNVYRDFLASMKERDGYWQALPGEVACWWRQRTSDDFEGKLASARILNGELEL